jgi:hypothetical protein
MGVAVVVSLTLVTVDEVSPAGVWYVARTWTLPRLECWE